MTSPRSSDPTGGRFEEPTGVGHDGLGAPHTRTSAAWTLAAVGAVLALLMLIFIFQNSSDVRLEFLFLEGDVPLGAALLLASVIGALCVVCLGAGRVLQLRLAARRHRRAASSPTA